MKLSFFPRLLGFGSFVFFGHEGFHGQRGEEFMRLGHSALELQKKHPNYALQLQTASSQSQ